MSDRSPGKRRGRRLMLATSVTSQIAALIRNIVVARLLGPEEFGIAATIILTVAFLDSLSNAGTQNLLVQAKDDDGELLATAHGISIVRGLLTTLLLVGIVAPLAHFADLGGLGPLSICLVAVSCLIAGFAHRGVRVVQRGEDFVSDGVSQLLGELCALVIAIAAALLTHSHIAIVIGIIARSAAVTLASHLLVRLPYKVSFSAPHMKQFWAFGWPLLINGPLVFLSIQADRIFVSMALGAEALGVYSAVAVLISSPSTAILKWMGTVSLPALSRFYHDVGRLEVRGTVYRYTTEMVMLAWLMLCGFSFFGPIAAPILYGDRYRVAASLTALVGALQVLRFLRAWPLTLALSVAASSSILKSTIIRFLALPLGFAGMMFFGGLEGLILGFAVGEGLALMVTLFIVNRAAGRQIASGCVCLFLFASLGAVVTWAAGHLPLTPVASVGAFALAVAFGSPLLALSVSRRQSIALVQSWQTGGADSPNPPAP